MIKCDARNVRHFFIDVENYMLEDILKEGFAEMNIACGDAELERFRIYCDYLDERNRVMNLTAIRGEEDTARLHFLDCGALLKYADFAGARVIDVGTGAGFPGLVLKMLRPDIRLTLLDSLDKRINFLSETCGKLGFADVECVHARAEEAPKEFRESFDIATSRAVARLSVLGELCLPLVRQGGVFLAMKGPDCAGEVREGEGAVKLLGGGITGVEEYTVPGTDVRHAVVRIQKNGVTNAKYPRRWAQIKNKPLGL